jgi:tetratricopeptide (TPR) repeat protein
MATDGLYRPLTMLSYLADRHLLGFGERPGGYVRENVALHFGCALLVYALLWRLLRSHWTAGTAAALFAVHPVTTEVVTNVVGRADLLAAVGVLAGMLAWAHGRDASGGRRILWGLGLALATVTALLGKENGIVLLAAVVLWDAVVAAPRARRVRPEHALVAAIFVGYLVARWWVDRAGLPPEDLSPIDNPLVELGWWSGRLTAVRVLGRLLGLVAWPARLSADYSYRAIPVVGWPPRNGSDWLAIAGAGVIVWLAWTLVRKRRQAPAAVFLAAFTAAAFLPTANLLRLIGSIMAERFLYLPLAGIVGLVALGLARVAPDGRRRTAATITVAVVLVALSARTLARNRDWRSELVLWEATTVAVPESAKAHKGFASALFAADPGRTDLARVIREGERAVAIRPDYQPALVDLGSYYITQGDLLRRSAPEDATWWYEQSIAVLERARTLDQHATTRFRARMTVRGHAPEAIPDVGDGTLYNNLTLAYLRTNRTDDALAALARLRDLSPLTASYYRDFGAILTGAGRWEEAAQAFFQAIEVGRDEEAAKALADTYRAHRPGAVSVAGEQVQIAGSDPVVRGHRCRALRELAEIFERARLPELAAAEHRAANEICAESAPSPGAGGDAAP